MMPAFPGRRRGGGNAPTDGHRSHRGNGVIHAPYLVFVPTLYEIFEGAKERILQVVGVRSLEATVEKAE